jgi:hypothetical protein
MPSNTLKVSKFSGVIRKEFEVPLPLKVLRLFSRFGTA